MARRSVARPQVPVFFGHDQHEPQRRERFSSVLSRSWEVTRFGTDEWQASVQSYRAPFLVPPRVGRAIVGASRRAFQFSGVRSGVPRSMASAIPIDGCTALFPRPALLLLAVAVPCSCGSHRL